MFKARNFSTAIGIMILAAICISGPAYSQQAVTFSEISDGLYVIDGGRGAKNYVYIGATGAALIDTKMDEASMRQVLDGIAKLTGKPLLFLIDTHSDADHVEGNRFVPESVTVISHENCRAEMFHPLRDGRSTGWEDPARTPFLPEVCFTDSMSLHLGGSERIVLRYFGPGHTTGDAVVWFPDRKTAIIGDQYAGGSIPCIHDYKGGNVFGHITQLERMLDALDATVFLGGHSSPVGRKEIEAEIADMRRHIREMEGRLAAGATIEDVTKGLEGKDALFYAQLYREVSARKAKE